MNGPRSAATAIFAGRVVGWTGTTVWRSAFIHFDGATTVLEPIPDGTTSIASAINSLGVVAGGGRLIVEGEPTWACCSRAFTWDGQRFAVLDPLDDHVHAAGRGITRQGVVIGASRTGGTFGVATVWVSGQAIDLNSLVVGAGDLVLHDAVAVNEHGQIAAAGRLPSGSVAVRLDPINANPADLDGDCDADHADLNQLLIDWGSSSSPGDLNSDGVVDALDFLFLLAHWG